MELTAFAGPEALTVVPVPPQEPGQGEVRVRVLASSVTSSDTVVRRGLSPYLGDARPPLVPGYAFVGTVEETGPGVTDLRTGARVVDVVRWGANSDTVVRPAATLTEVAADVDPVSVEPLVMQGVTAYQILHRLGGLRQGQTLLVQGASSGVGLLAAQIGVLLGARVIGTASPRKLTVLTERGIAAVDRLGVDVAAAIRSWAPDGVDLAVDGVGAGALRLAGEVLAPRGLAVSFGFAEAAAGVWGRTPEVLERAAAAFGEAAQVAATLEARGLRTLPYEVVTARTEHPDHYAEDLGWLVDRVRDGSLVPLVATVTLDGLARAHADVEAGRVRGRLVVDHRPAP